MTSFIMVYITNPSKKEARRIANHLLDKRLIACANIYGVNSLYHWKGKIADEKEVILIAKTLDSSFEKVKAEVEKIHPYEVPCIVKIPVNSNQKYFDWISHEVSQ